VVGDSGAAVSPARWLSCGDLDTTDAELRYHDDDGNLLSVSTALDPVTSSDPELYSSSSMSVINHHHHQANSVSHPSGVGKSRTGLVSINEVALQPTRLILGWVNVCWQINHLGQLSLPSLRVGKSTTVPASLAGVKAACVHLCRAEGNAG